MVFTDTDIKAIQKAIEIRNRGGYVSGQEITTLYNRVLERSLQPTNCIGCIRQRISELERVLKGYLKQIEKEQVATEENKPQDLQSETNNSVPEEKEEKTEIKKKGRPKKNK